jgi:hypothetical protein
MFESIRGWKARTFPIFNKQGILKPRKYKKKAPKFSPKSRQLIDFDDLDAFVNRSTIDDDLIQEKRREEREQRDLAMSRAREIKRKFNRPDFKLQILETDISLQDGMMRYEGIDKIKQGLTELNIGEVAFLRIERVGSYYDNDRRYAKTYGFRMVYRGENETSHWDLKSHRDYQMIDVESYWGKSCFSDWDSSIEDNIQRMLDHDDEDNLEAVEMIVCHVLNAGQKEKALLAIQNECYNVSRLKINGCRVFEKHFSDLDSEVTSGDIFDYQKVADIW